MLKRILFALALAAATVPAIASSVRELELDEIIDGAKVAFQGVVTENRAARDAQTGRIVTFTTFMVVDPLKGKVGTTHTIKQLGGVLPSEGVGYKVDARTRFEVGQTYVVFLYGESSLGFSSPVGTSQGSFTVVEDESGPAVSNGRDFAKLTQHLSGGEGVAKATAKTRADGKKVGLEEFKAIVRGRAEGVK